MTASDEIWMRAYEAAFLAANKREAKVIGCGHGWYLVEDAGPARSKYRKREILEMTRRLEQRVLESKDGE